jgi:alpha-glucosidase
MMSANRMALVAGGPKEIVFDRISEAQNLRCRFDFETLTASIAEI